MFSIENTLSCPNGVLVLAQHDDTAKEWGALGYRDIFLSVITYEPKIKIRTVQGEECGRTLGHPKVVRTLLEKPKMSGGSEQTVKGEAVISRRLGQVEVPAESRTDVSAHSFWKRGTTAMFNI